MSRPVYTTSLVSRMTGVSVRRLDYLARESIVVPSIQQSQKRGSPKIYSLDDIVQVQFIARLRTQGWSLQEIRKVVVQLREVMEDPHPLRTAVVFDGKKTILALCKTKAGERIFLDTQRPGHQQVMWIVVEALIEETRRVIEAQQPAIVSRREEVHING